MSTAAPTETLNWKRPFVNAGRLLLGRGVQGVMSLGYTSLAAHALGATGFGVLTLIYATTMMLKNLLGFRSWQMIMSYGAQAMSRFDGPHMRKLVAFSLVIEASAAIIGAVVICLFAAPAAQLFSIPAEYTQMFELYSILLIIWMVSDVGLGILRLFDKHGQVSMQVVVEPAVRLLGSLIMYYLGGGVMGFLWVWFVAGICSKVVLILLGLRTLRKELKTLDTAAEKPAKLKLFDIYKEPEKGVWRYALGTNVQSALAANYAPMLIASVLGPAGAGVWRVAQRFASVIINPVNKLLIPVIYTDMTWLNAAGDQKKRTALLIKTGAVAGGVSLGLVLIMALVGKYLIAKLFGVEFVEAYTPMIILALTTLVTAFTFGLGPMLMTAGRVWQLTMVRVVVMAVYFAVIIPLVKMYGVTGAAIATFINAFLSTGMTIYIGRDLLKNLPEERAKKKAKKAKA